MKFFLTLFLFGALTVLLCAGILMALKGSFWLLATALIIYLLGFTKFGCLSH
jgi:hypothetical protein